MDVCLASLKTLHTPLKTRGAASAALQATSTEFLLILSPPSRHRPLVKSPSPDLPTSSLHYFRQYHAESPFVENSTTSSLDHPWIKQTSEETTAAADAPPLATPLISRQQPQGQEKGASLMGSAQYAYLDETPGSKRMDFRSPGAVNLREVFDVSYAVHRQEEEQKRRKNFKQGYRGQLNALDEDEDPRLSFQTFAQRAGIISKVSS